jgi:hypothetical protein
MGGTRGLSAPAFSLEAATEFDEPGSDGADASGLDPAVAANRPVVRSTERV